MTEFLSDLGSETRERNSPSLRGSIVAAGALLAVAGLVAIAVDVNESETNVLGILVGVIAIGAGHVVIVRLPPSVRPAAIALIAVGTVTALGFVFDDVESPTILLLLLAIAYGGQWGWGPARGSIVLLTLSLLSVWAFLLDAAASDDPGPTSFADDTFELFPDTTLTSGDEIVGYLSLAIGILLLFAGRSLDRDGWHGVATSAVVVGDIAFVVGVFSVVGTLESDAFGSLLILAAGVALALVGSTGGRRFTTWLGGIGVFIGLITLIISAFDGPDDVVPFGITALVVGAALVLGGAYLDLNEAEAGDGDNSGEAIPPAAESPTTDEATLHLPAADATTAAQGWHPDPTGRHELRWHDGSGWTINVSDNGATATDEGV